MNSLNAAMRLLVDTNRNRCVLCLTQHTVFTFAPFLLSTTRKRFHFVTSKKSAYIAQHYMWSLSCRIFTVSDCWILIARFPKIMNWALKNKNGNPLNPKRKKLNVAPYIFFTHCSPWPSKNCEMCTIGKQMKVIVQPFGNILYQTAQRSPK